MTIWSCVIDMYRYTGVTYQPYEILQFQLDPSSGSLVIVGEKCHRQTDGRTGQKHTCL